MKITGDNLAVPAELGQPGQVALAPDGRLPWRKEHVDGGVVCLAPEAPSGLSEMLAAFGGDQAAFLNAGQRRRKAGNFGQVKLIAGLAFKRFNTDNPYHGGLHALRANIALSAALGSQNLPDQDVIYDTPMYYGAYFPLANVQGAEDAAVPVWAMEYVSGSTGKDHLLQFQKHGDELAERCAKALRSLGSLGRFIHPDHRAPNTIIVPGRAERATRVAKLDSHLLSLMGFARAFAAD